MGALGLARAFKDLQIAALRPLTLLMPAEKPQGGLWEASGRGLRGPLKRTIWRMGDSVQGLGYLTKGDRTGYACGTGSSVARRRALGSRAASPAGFGAFALLDGPGLTQFRGLGCRV